MKKALIFLFVTAGFLYFSWKNSAAVYRFYVRTYYWTFKSSNAQEYVKQAKSLLNEDSPDFPEFIETMMIAYPERNEFTILGGEYYLTKGDNYKGIKLLIKALRFDPTDIPVLSRVLSVMTKEKMFEDMQELLSRYDKNSISTDGTVLLAYAVTLYKKGEYNESLKTLASAKTAGGDNSSIFFYTGLCYLGKGDSEENAQIKNQYYESAVVPLEKARQSEPGNSDFSRALIQAYKKTGRSKEAEFIIRKHVE